MKKVLYIDDEADTEKMSSMFDLLTGRGLEVEHVCDVGSVMPILAKEKGKYGVIVLDIIMPPEGVYSLAETVGGTSTGIRLLGDIRKSGIDTPVVIVSVSRRGGFEGKFGDLNVRKFFEKPVDEDELADVLLSILGGGAR